MAESSDCLCFVICICFCFCPELGPAQKMNVLMDAGQRFSYARDIVFMYFPFPTFYSTIFSSSSRASSAPAAAANVDLNNLLLAFVCISQCVCCVFAGKHFWNIMCVFLIVWLWVFVYLPQLSSGLYRIPSSKQQINLNLFKFIAELWLIVAVTISLKSNGSNRTIQNFIVISTQIFNSNFAGNFCIFYLRCLDPLWAADFLDDFGV